MGVYTCRQCPQCYMYTYVMKRDVMRYTCTMCGYSETAEEMVAGVYAGYYGPGWLDMVPKKDPVPTAFTRTKGKKPTRAELEALSVAIDNPEEVTP